MSGFASKNGFDDRPPVYPPLALADMVEGLRCVCRYDRAARGRRGGKGRLSICRCWIRSFLSSGQTRRSIAFGRVRAAHRQPVADHVTAQCLRRRTAVHCDLWSIHAMAERVFRAIGKPEMIDDPRFRTNTDRVRHIDECDGAVAEFIAHRTLDENMAVFQAAEVTATPVYRSITRGGRADPGTRRYRGGTGRGSGLGADAQRDPAAIGHAGEATASRTSAGAAYA